MQAMALASAQANGAQQASPKNGLRSMSVGGLRSVERPPPLQSSMSFDHSLLPASVQSQVLLALECALTPSLSFLPRLGSSLHSLASDGALATTEPHSSADNSAVLEASQADIPETMSPLALSRSPAPRVEDAMVLRSSSDSFDECDTSGSAALPGRIVDRRPRNHRRKRSGSEPQIRSSVTIQSPKLSSPLWRRRMSMKSPSG